MAGEDGDGGLFDKAVQFTEKVNAGDPSYLLPDEVMNRFRTMLSDALIAKGYKDKELESLLKSGLAQSSKIRTFSDGELADFVNLIVGGRRF
jgi:hypothetical protein